MKVQRSSINEFKSSYGSIIILWIRNSPFSSRLVNSRRGGLRKAWLQRFRTLGENVSFAAYTFTCAESCRIGRYDYDGRWNFRRLYEIRLFALPYPQISRLKTSSPRRSSVISLRRKFRTNFNSSTRSLHKRRNPSAWTCRNLESLALGRLVNSLTEFQSS